MQNRVLDRAKGSEEMTEENKGSNQGILFPMISQEDIKVEVGTIKFDGFPALRLSVERLVEKMKTVEVTEENVKESKQLVARVRKEVDALNDERKRVERFYLSPLDDFKRGIKEVGDLIKEAEESVRSQVRTLDEIERETKYQDVQMLFDLRVKAYDLKGMFDFSDFYRREFTNKTYTLSKVESEMVEWLGKIESDLNFLSEQPEAAKVLAEYKDTKDVALAIKHIEEQNKYYSELEKRMQHVVTVSNPDFVNTKQEFKFTVFGENDASMLREFLGTTGIKFREV